MEWRFFKGSPDLYGKIKPLKAQRETQQPACNEYGPVAQSFQKQQAFTV
jgi:hypothetical protein